MTNNQEKLLRGKLTKWLRAKGETPEDVERKTNAWLQYFDGIKKPVVALAACTWLCSWAVILPEDMPKVEQAVRIAEKNRVDPLLFDRPMAVFEAFPSTELKEAPIDPDMVPTLHLAKRFDSGLAIYDVDEGLESRVNMRKIINTHFGPDSNPWCLLQGDGEGNLTEDSVIYWNHYKAYQMQVAFVDGKLVAFSANDNSEKVWWDRMDESHDDIVVKGRIKGDPLGRSATCCFNPETGDVRYENIIRRCDDVFVERYTDIEDRDYTLDILVDPKERENITSVVIPEGVKEIGYESFRGFTSMEEVYLPNSLEKIGSGAFMGCTSMKRAYIPEGVKYLGDSAYWGCTSMEEAHLPNSLEVIGDYAFYGCTSMRRAYIQEGAKVIGRSAFRLCTSMEVAYIPNSLEEIGYMAFDRCTSLKEVHIPATAPHALIEMIRKAIPSGCALVRDLLDEDLSALNGLGLSKEDIGVLSKTGCFKGEDFDFVIKDDGRVWCCIGETAVRLEDAIKHVEVEERKVSVSIDLSR